MIEPRFRKFIDRVFLLIATDMEMVTGYNEEVPFAILENYRQR